MKNYLYTPGQSSYPVCILVDSINGIQIESTYLAQGHINKDHVCVLDLYKSPTHKKTPVKEIKEYVNNELLPVLSNIKAEYVICTNAEYFKVLSGKNKADVYCGYVLDTDYGFKIIYMPSPRAIFHDPVKNKTKITQGLVAYSQHLSGVYREPGEGVASKCIYPQTFEEVVYWLDKIVEMNVDITYDIEAFDLKFHKAGLGTICICWSEEEGIAFPIDYVPLDTPVDGVYGKRVYNEKMRALLRSFFTRLTKRRIAHNITFDATVLIYELFMDNLIDREGMITGVEQFLKDSDCTKIISYLATNSCAGNKLSLKDQAQEFAGNYAVEDIKDITRIPLQELLEYNVIDGLSTMYVYNKNLPIMIQDQQEEIYRTLFLPAVNDVVQMQLTGLPVDIKRAKEVNELMAQESNNAIRGINDNDIIKRFRQILKEKWVETRNTTLKVKRVTIDDAPDLEFNPNSPPQLQELLFSFLGLPILGYTDSGQPGTGGKTLKSLKDATTDKEVLDLLDHLIDYKALNKILTSVMPVLVNAIPAPDGHHYVFGFFNLGGTVSGRLSSNDMNLQNIPVGGRLGALVLSCFKPPKGWLFVGLDFSSLEDRISALTTKDVNKLKVYTDGYDGHCLRAFSYFGEEMPDIVPDDVASINSIEDKYPILRQDSKVPTFLLTYQGTWMGIVRQCRMTEERAKQIEARYKELYAQSIKWVNDKLNQASIDGYVTVAFGLRVRTPVLAQSIRGTSKTPFEVEAEGRTAGNALGQSWGLLNTRAGVAFNGRVRQSEHRVDILPCAQIHDAQYFLIRDDVQVIQYVNTHLVEEVSWQDHPDIYHPEVKLGGNLTIYYPTWATALKIPNHATNEEIIELASNHINKLKEAA